ncbi:hypothetical protein, partial [Bradyrhizobium japonicum]|uniref:hypothetical protein n=1 Tax=Bradyrhizobium japonicum TaxID=375 RepID=UPI001AEC2BBB
RENHNSSTAFSHSQGHLQIWRGRATKSAKGHVWRLWVGKDILYACGGRRSSHVFGLLARFT